MNRSKQTISGVSRFVFPQRIQLGNRAFSESIILTMHAWERFCERYIQSQFGNRPAPTDQEFFLQKLRECFRRAKRENLPEEIVAERRANNNNRNFLYLRDPATKLGFIVSNDLRRQATLITVDPAIENKRPA